MNNELNDYFIKLTKNTYNSDFTFRLNLCCLKEMLNTLNNDKFSIQQFNLQLLV